MEGSGIVGKPDIYLRDVRDLAKKSDIGIVLYEWNLFANPGIINKTIFDLDGVFCVDPPDERNITKYLKYIENPEQLFIPTTDGTVTVLTYRLNKYRPETESFLKTLGLNKVHLYMYNAETYEKRSKVPPYIYKGEFYKQATDFKLFVESSDYQARKINEISGKPVYCVETNKMYNEIN